MAILTDGVHLISDKSVDELHAFAQRIGLKRCWYQGMRKRHPHYDLTTENKLQQAIQAGARQVKSSDVVKALWRLYGGPT